MSDATGQLHITHAPEPFSAGLDELLLNARPYQSDIPLLPAFDSLREKIERLLPGGEVAA